MKTPVALILSGIVFLAACCAEAATLGSSKQAYDATAAHAADEFKAARARCDVLTGNPKDVCIAEAKAARVYAEANARVQYKKTLDATTDGRKDVAQADYEVERARCGNLTGNPRDVCLKEAKANLVSALADAKADRKITEARTDAQEDKRSADYQVALEKCDAVAGGPKKACVASVKAQFGK